MDGGAWQFTVCGVTRVGYDLVTKPPPQQHLEKLAEVGKRGKEKIHSGVLGSGMTMANLWSVRDNIAFLKHLKCDDNKQTYPLSLAV